MKTTMIDPIQGTDGGRKRFILLQCPVCGTLCKTARSHPARQMRTPPEQLQISAEELAVLVEEFPVAQIAGIYCLSAKTIRKYCRSLGIPLTGQVEREEPSS